MKRKELGRFQWRRAIDRRDAHKVWESKAFTGETSLIHVLKAEKPNIKKFLGKEPVTILDDGFFWMQVAVQGQHWWLTAMFDPQLRPTQYYFDITLENHLLGSEKSWFWDIYLDVVLMPDGRMELLDADELEEALCSGDITKEQYENAWIWAKKLMEELQGKQELIQNFCQEKLNEMLPLLK